MPKSSAASVSRSSTRNARGARTDASGRGSATRDYAPPHLTPTDDPAVWRNREGELVDSNGVLLSLKTMAPAQKQEAELAEELIGGPADSPAKVLKLVALNPALPLRMRIDAAHKAAPYFDVRMPLRLEGDVNTTQTTLDASALSKLSREERESLLALLKKVGANV